MRTFYSQAIMFLIVIRHFQLHFDTILIPIDTLHYSIKFQLIYFNRNKILYKLKVFILSIANRYCKYNNNNSFKI